MTTTGLTIAGRTKLGEAGARACFRRLVVPYHFVAIDTETTGKTETDRIIDIALLSWNSYKSWGGRGALINPGPRRIGATHVHHLTAADLVDATAFQDNLDWIEQALRAPKDKQLVLVGFRVGFDVRRLAFEFGLADAPFPVGMLVLDIANLARATERRPKRDSLAGHLECLELSNPVAHSATSDALVTGAAAAKMLSELAGYGIEDISGLLGSPSDRSRSRSTGYDGDEIDPEDKLDPEHEARHAQELLSSAVVRAESLSYCLERDCPSFPYRVEDTCTTTQRARTMLDWCADQLSGELSRGQAGLAAGAMGRALWHCAFSYDALVAKYKALRPTMDRWGFCDEDSGQCDRCQQARTCRFVRLRQRFANAAIYDQAGNLSRKRADGFLPVAEPPKGTVASVKRPRAGLYAWMITHEDPYGAAQGAVLAARARKRGRDVCWSLSTLGIAWNDGLRNASLAYTYSTMLEQQAGKAAHTELERLYAICEEAVEKHPALDGYYTHQLTARHLRLGQRIRSAASAATPRPAAAHRRANQPIGRRNPREAPTNPYAVE